LRAKERGLENLRAQVKAAEQEAQPDPATNRATMGQHLLDDIESLNKGAFAPIWDSPLIGAILIPSGGSVLIELLSSILH
jgi:hypothetical protein